ncbi:hypothetical protein LTR66_001115 [Elasticomyces elasticus]|nr:hypothetical protein LTR28_003556 [Elasticomyces elasticus]KAK4999935.1 hypothetical protein LTR66_001115 [Elasticomyces elasticus]
MTKVRGGKRKLSASNVKLVDLPGDDKHSSTPVIMRKKHKSSDLLSIDVGLAERLREPHIRIGSSPEQVPNKIESSSSPVYFSTSPSYGIGSSISSVYSMTSPEQASNGYEAPSAPGYFPSSPVYVPSSPVYVPSSPVYMPSSPVYIPSSPGYFPSSPVYIPSSPVYVPFSPGYSPSSPGPEQALSVLELPSSSVDSPASPGFEQASNDLEASLSPVDFSMWAGFDQAPNSHMAPISPSFSPTSLGPMQAMNKYESPSSPVYSPTSPNSKQAPNGVGALSLIANGTTSAYLEVMEWHHTFGIALATAPEFDESTILSPTFPIASPTSEQATEDFKTIAATTAGPTLMATADTAATAATGSMPTLATSGFEVIDTRSNPHNFRTKLSQGRPWSADEYTELSKKLVESFNTFVFAYSHGRTIDEVEQVINRLVRNPLSKAADDVSGGQDGPDKHLWNQAIRGWGKNGELVKGALRGTKDGVVYLFRESDGMAVHFFREALVRADVEYLMVVLDEEEMTELLEGPNGGSIPFDEYGVFAY